MSGGRKNIMGGLLLCFIVSGIMTVVGQNENGKMDAIEDFALKYTVPFTMPDGVDLMSDIYIPIFTDSLTIPVNLNGLGTVNISLLEKGGQYIIYDSINGKPNPNPYELPTILVRTPYSKDTESIGHLLAFLGYSVIIQDNRGAYASGGNYLPMFSDSWKKSPYHPDFVHSLDQYGIDDSINANHHADGVHSLDIILNNLTRIYDGQTVNVSNGSVGMIGASALGNVQYQLASAAKIDPTKPGLKGLFPIVASNEHYKNTAVQNGVFREALVTNWITRQYNDLLDDADPNANHSSSDYKLNSKQKVADEAIAYWITKNNAGEPAGYYPNSPIRAELDASFASVNELGLESAKGEFSRYSNMEVPMYHLSGWWDIFIEGQIETFNQLRTHLNTSAGNIKKQKLVIGPWAHQTITEYTTGDVRYPNNTNDFLIDLQKVGEDFESFPLGRLLNSEVISWFRYTLNDNSFKKIGSPKVRISASNKWQNLSGNLQILVPASDYVIPYHEFVNFVGGKGELKNFPYKLKQLGFEFDNTIDVSPIDDSFVTLQEEVKNSGIRNMAELPDVRLYIASAVQNGAGNYWMEADSFPFFKGIKPSSLFFNEDGNLTLNHQIEVTEKSFIHDPDRPVLTAGGANMTVRSPQNHRNSQGQINLASTANARFTMDRPDVLRFESQALVDSLTIIGYPKATLFASSMPIEHVSDSTNTDFFVRILEVLPTGEEFFVVEGAIGARARLYASEIAERVENHNIPFTNIKSGKIYKYTFKCMPIAYTFQAQSRIKILVSSSNYPRYQSNPNIPLMHGEFFLRKPNEIISYLYHGKAFYARKAEQNIFMGDEYSSSIELPVFMGEPHLETDVEAVGDLKGNSISVYPNPADRVVSVLSVPNETQLSIYSLSGELMMQKKTSDRTEIEVSSWEQGVYVLSFTSRLNDTPFTSKLVIRH